MAVVFDHRASGASRALVIHGIDTLSAVRHLCAELEHGAGPIDSIVVLDLTAAPLVAEAAASDLDALARILRRERRWLGVVEPLRALASQPDGWYVTCGDAVDAGRRYLTWVGGRAAVGPDLTMLVRGVTAVVTWTPDLLRSALEVGFRAVGYLAKRAIRYGVT